LLSGLACCERCDKSGFRTALAAADDDDAAIVKAETMIDGVDAELRDGVRLVKKIQKVKPLIDQAASGRKRDLLTL
jgi:hypothetical protein